MPHAVNIVTVWGLAMVALGVILRWRTSRYDLKDKALSSAYQAVRGKRTAQSPTALDEELRDITSQTTLTGKATTAAGKVAGHFISQVVSVIALLLVLIGAGLTAYGIFGK